jgi:hypothetical protein
LLPFTTFLLSFLSQHVFGGRKIRKEGRTIRKGRGKEDEEGKEDKE